MPPDRSDSRSTPEHAEAIRTAALRYEAELFALAPDGTLPDARKYLDSVPEEAREQLQELIDRMSSFYAARADSLVDPGRTMAEGTLYAYVSSESIASDRTIMVPGACRSTGKALDQTGRDAGDSQFAEDLQFDGSDHGDVTRIVRVDESGMGSGDSRNDETIADCPPVARGPAVIPSVRGYEIVGELGRGGMGVVYKARQVKLNRTVALKMVISGVHAGKEELGRFFAEAEAVASLVHPNIVQIFEVADHNGIPFFSLEYVSGGSLAERLTREPMQAQDAARLVESLARAMTTAHAQGVIHRDLKPANVLITGDGVPKITDFGLAKRMEADSSQTRSGTLLGTPNYMAPEQARGDTQKIGPLADVYALGVILYECLTGRTPFVGTSVMDTLQQVQKLEPVPPRQLQPKIPTDLETICLKCLQKEPEKRYSSAQALADDLHRFIEGQPILARPVSTTERLLRWARRNPKVAALSSTVLALLLFTAVGSTIAAFRISQAREAAIIARLWFEQKARSEERLRSVADQSAKEAEAARAVADANAKIANDQSALALNTLQLLVVRVQEQLEDAPRTQQLKKDLLTTAMSGLKQVAQHAEKSSSTEATMAAAHMKMGQMFRQLGDTEEAFKQFELCHEITRRRAVEHPNWAASQANLAATFTMLGNMSQEIRRDMKASLGSYEKALAIYRSLVENPKGNGERPVDPLLMRRNLAETYTRIAVTFLRLGDPAAAAVEFAKAVEIRKEIVRDKPDDERALLDLTRSYIALAEVHFRTNDRQKALEYYEECLKVRERLVQEKPDDLRRRWELAAICGNLGDFRLHCGEPELARPLYVRNLEMSRKFVEEDPKNADFMRELGVALMRSGILAFETKSPEADGYFKECLAIREKLAQEDTGNERRQVDLMLILPRVGEHEKAAKIADGFAAKAGTADPELHFETARAYAGCVAAAGPDDKLRSEYSRKAVEAISRAIDTGYRDWVALETEPDLDPIRNDPEFLSRVAGLKASSSAGSAKP